MAFGLRDVVLAIRLQIDKASMQKVRDDLQNAINQGTAPANAQANLDKIDAKLDGLSKTINKVGIALAAAFAGKVIFNFIEESIAAFARFDQKLQQSVAIMGNVSAEMRKRLGDTAREVAKEVNISAEEVAQGYYYLVSAGMNAQQSLKALPIAAAFAKASFMNMKDATEKLALAVSSLGYTSKDPEKQLASMARVADVLTKASKTSQTTIEQLTNALTNKAAQSLKLFHKDVEEGAAALMMFANAGVRGQVAGERLDIFMRQVSAAALHHAEAFKHYGIAIFDANGKMRSFADISHDLTRAMNGLSDAGVNNALSQLGIQQRTQASVKLFIGAEDALRKYEKSLEDAGGTTVKIADKMMQTPAEKWGQFQKKIMDVRMEIGENFVGAITNTTDLLGDETNPDSLVGMLHKLAMVLNENQESIGILAKAIVWLATKPLVWLFDAFNILADLIVGPVNVALMTVFTVFGVLGSVTEMAAEALGKFFHMIGDDTSGASMDRLAARINKVADAMLRFGTDRREVAEQNASDLWNRLSGSFRDDPKGKPKTRLIDAKPKGKGGRDNDGDGTGDDGAGGDHDEKARKRAQRAADHIRALNDQLNTQIARHTQERVDDEMQKLKKLEEAYTEAYGGKIPETVKKALKELRAQVKQEGAAKAIADMFKEEFKEGAEDEEIIPRLGEFIKKVQALKATAKQGSVEWKSYSETLEKSIVLLTKLTEKAGDKAEKDKEKKAKEDEKAAEDRLKRIGRITDTVAHGMENAFNRAFRSLLTGAKNGESAMHALKDVALSAMTAPLIEYATNKAKEQFLEAGSDMAKGFSFLGDPVTAGLAPGMFLAAAKHAAMGTAWAALGGGAGAAGAAAGGGGGTGNFSDSGRRSLDQSTQQRSDINIYVDGLDPKNSQHQVLVGQTLEELAQRGGGNLKIQTKR